MRIRGMKGSPWTAATGRARPGGSRRRGSRRRRRSRPRGVACGAGGVAGVRAVRHIHLGGLVHLGRSGRHVDAAGRRDDRPPRPRCRGGRARPGGAGGPGVRAARAGVRRRRRPGPGDPSEPGRRSGGGPDRVRAGAPPWPRGSPRPRPAPGPTLPMTTTRRPFPARFDPVRPSASGSPERPGTGTRPSGRPMDRDRSGQNRGSRIRMVRSKPAGAVVQPRPPWRRFSGDRTTGPRCRPPSRPERRARRGFMAPRLKPDGGDPWVAARRPFGSLCTYISRGGSRSRRKSR